MEQFWIIVGSITVLLVFLTIWLIVLARRPSTTPTPRAGHPADEPEVKVEVANLFKTYEQPRDLGPSSFSVTGINRSNHPIRFTSAGFELPDGKQIVMMRQPYSSSVIGTVPPHDSGQTWMECDALADAGLDI